MATTVFIDSIGSDGTNLYTEMRISDGKITFPTIRPSFPVGTSAATIRAFAQQIANNTPTLAADVAAIVGTSVSS